MRDRPARDAMIEVIQSYLDDEITASELDDALCEISGATRDRTVSYVCECFWHQYDDCEDHLVVATKAQWDYIQRLLLLLESEAEVKVGRRYGYSSSGLAALISLVILAVFGFLDGFGVRTLVATAISAWAIGAMGRAENWLSEGSKEEPDPTLTPYSSVAELLKVRRAVPQFSKARYREELRRRKVRSAVEHMWLIVFSRCLYIALVVAMPLVDLVRLAFEYRGAEFDQVTIVLPEPGSA